MTTDFELDWRSVFSSEPAEGTEEHWKLDTKPIEFGWMQMRKLEGETYGWPDGNQDEYETFFQFKGGPPMKGFEERGNMWSGHMFLGIGYKPSGEIIGFVMNEEADWKRGIVYFQLTDDYDETGETISLIKGAGENGRSTFKPDGPAPAPYSDFRLESVADRVDGKWNALGVVAPKDFHTHLRIVLDHTALQARLRGLG